jgi:Peptidase family M48
MSDTVVGNADRLVPLKYHDDLVSYLQRDEAAVWEWSRSAEVRQRQADEMRDAMLRQTYRLEPEGHPVIYAACQRAMEKLGIEAPATLYQAADGMMNAALCFIPGEVHLIFYGPILEKLSGDELLALMGHELAHYRLWTAKDGAYYNVSRVLDHALSYSDASPSHRETARLFSLHTELYADRGAAIVADSTAPAIAVLVKTMTGISAVDPAAYLRQAEELDAKAEKSDGQSHPEVFLRARALDQWWREIEGAEDWIEKRLCGVLSIESLDLLRQRELSKMTRAFFVRLLAELGIQSEQAATQVRRYFPDMRQGEEASAHGGYRSTRRSKHAKSLTPNLVTNCLVIG